MATNKYIHQLSGITNPSLTGFTAYDNETSTYKLSLSNLRQTLVDSGSHYFTGSQVINGNLTVSGSITAQQYIVSSSLINVTNYNVSGSSVFGNSLDDKHQFTGSVNITGSFTINGTTFSGMTSGTSGTSGINGSSGTSGQSSILGLTWKKGDFSNEGYFGIGPSNQYLSVDYFLFNNTSWDYNNNSVSSTGNATNFLNGISFGTIFHFTKIDQPQNFGIYRVTGVTTGSTSTTVYVEDLAGNSLQGIQSGETYSVFYTNSGDSIFAETGSFWATTNDVQVTGSFDVEGPITATYFNSTDTNTAENYKVGDNVWLGDVGELNTLVVKGVNDSGSAFIKFGYGTPHQHPYLGHVGDEDANVLSVVADTTKFSNAIIVGSGSLVAGNPEMVHVYSSGSYNIAYFVGESDTYSQINVKNISGNSDASSDIVCTADNGTEDIHYVNLGINSSGYEFRTESIGYQNDAYLYNVGQDMYIGVMDPSSPEHGHLHLFSEGLWYSPSISIIESGSIGFNTGSVTSGFTYEFSGGVKLQNELNVDGTLTSTNGIYVNVLYPLSGSNTITIDSPNLNVDTITANSLVVTGSVSGDGFGRFATTGSNSFVDDQQITGSVYIDITDSDKRIYFSINGDTNTYMGTTMGSLTFTDGAGYIQLDAQNQDGSGNYAYLTLNANNDNTLFFVGDNTPSRINASINLSTSGSFNISTNDNTATLLINGVLYDAHLVSTSSFNSFTASVATTGSNDFVGDQTIDGILYLQDPGNDLGDTAQIVNNGDALILSAQDDRKILLSVYSGSVYEWEFGVDGDLTVPGNINGANNLVSTSSFNEFTSSQEITNENLNDDINILYDTKLNTSSFNDYTSSLATTGSNTFEGNQQVNGWINTTDYIITDDVLYTNAIEENTTNGGITFVAGGFGFAFNNNIEVTGSLIIEGVSEVLTIDGGFSGNRDFDYTSGSIFYLTGLTGNGTWNINNVPTTNDRGVTMTFVVEQGGTAYSGSGYSFDSNPVTIKWADSTVPTGSANKTEVIGLTAFRVGSSWNVLGSLSSFGS